MSSLRESLVGLREGMTNSYKDMQTYPYFAGVFLTGCLFIFLSICFAPMIVLSPTRVANFFNVGSVLILCSFAVLYGTHEYCVNRFICGPRRWYAIGYIISLMLCLYFSIERRSLLFLIFLLFELAFLIIFLAAYFPGGKDGILYLFSFTWGLIKKCFMSCTNS